MYEYFTIDDNIQGCDAKIEQVTIFVHRHVDYASPAIRIDTKDTEALAIFEEFRSKMKQHFITLKNKS